MAKLAMGAFVGKLAVVVTMKDCLDGELSNIAHQGKVLASPDNLYCVSFLVFWWINVRWKNLWRFFWEV